MKLMNLTLHEVTVYCGNEAVLTVPPEGVFARLEEHEAVSPGLWVEGIELPTTLVAYTGRVLDLPDPQPGVLLVVSRVLASAIHRLDLVFPNGEVRDAQGRIVGCQSLGRFRASPVEAFEPQLKASIQKNS